MANWLRVLLSVSLVFVGGSLLVGDCSLRGIPLGRLCYWIGALVVSGALSWPYWQIHRMRNPDIEEESLVTGSERTWKAYQRDREYIDYKVCYHQWVYFVTYMAGWYGLEILLTNQPWRDANAHPIAIGALVIFTLMGLTGDLIKFIQGLGLLAHELGRAIANKAK